MTAEKAPEPLDINWENMRATMYSTFFLKLFSFFIYTITLTAGFFILYFIALWQREINNNNNPKDDFWALFLSVIWASLVIFINFLLRTMIIYLSSKEKNITKTELEMSMAF
jgi:hypothetical protein